MPNLLGCAVALTVVFAAQDSHPTLPLVITQMWVESEAGLPAGDAIFRVEVLNTGKRGILAWGVRFTVTSLDNTVGQINEFALDSATVFPEARTGSVAPGRTTHNSGGGAGVPVGSVLSNGVVTFVIFDDDTALGEEREIAFQFEHRQNQQAFWHKMQAILDDATAHTADGSAALSQIRERMETEADPRFREGVYYRELLARMSARRIEPAGTIPQQVLDNLRETITAQKANADAHAVRR